MVIPRRPVCIVERPVLADDGPALAEWSVVLRNHKVLRVRFDFAFDGHGVFLLFAWRVGRPRRWVG